MIICDKCKKSKDKILTGYFYPQSIPVEQSICQLDLCIDCIKELTGIKIIDWIEEDEEDGKETNDQ